MKNHFIIAHEYQVLGLEVGVSEGYETIKKRNDTDRSIEDGIIWGILKRIKTEKMLILNVIKHLRRNFGWHLIKS